jgi:CBS domain-containing protein
VSTVAEVLRHKGTEVHSVTPETSVLEALRLMAEKNIGGVPVVDGTRLVGIFTERDYARKVVLLGRASRDTPVREIMTPQVVCVGQRHTMEQCMALMTEHRLRHLPVLEGDRLAGIVSIGDVVRAVIGDREFTIHQLEHYIMGAP